MKKTILLSLIISSLLSFAAPVIFYNTYQDYKNNKGEDVGEYKNLINVNLLYTLKVEKGGKTEKYKNEDLAKIWAFETGGILYRFTDDKLLEVLYVGENVMVYESSTLRMTSKSDYVPGSVKDKDGGGVYFAERATDIPEDLYADKKGFTVSYIRDKHPKLSKAFDAIDLLHEEYGKKMYFTKVIQCFVDFDKKK